MKNILVTLVLAFSLISAFAAETKKTCVDQTDAKTNQTKQVCKVIKQHKKLEAPKAPASAPVVVKTPDKTAK